MNAKKWMVIAKETGISHSYHATKAEAEKVAKEMTQYHQKAYIVTERR